MKRQYFCLSSLVIFVFALIVFDFHAHADDNNQGGTSQNTTTQVPPTQIIPGPISAGPFLPYNITSIGNNPVDPNESTSADLLLAPTLEGNHVGWAMGGVAAFNYNSSGNIAITMGSYDEGHRDIGLYGPGTGSGQVLGSATNYGHGFVPSSAIVADNPNNIVYMAFTMVNPDNSSQYYYFIERQKYTPIAGSSESWFVPSSGWITQSFSTDPSNWVTATQPSSMGLTTPNPLQPVGAEDMLYISAPTTSNFSIQTPGGIAVSSSYLFVSDPYSSTPRVRTFNKSTGAEVTSLEINLPPYLPGALTFDSTSQTLWVAWRMNTSPYKAQLLYGYQLNGSSWQPVSSTPSGFDNIIGVAIRTNPAYQLVVADAGINQVINFYKLVQGVSGVSGNTPSQVLGALGGTNPAKWMGGANRQNSAGLQDNFDKTTLTPQEIHFNNLLGMSVSPDGGIYTVGGSYDAWLRTFTVGLTQSWYERSLFFEDVVDSLPDNPNDVFGVHSELTMNDPANCNSSSSSFINYPSSPPVEPTDSSGITLSIAQTLCDSQWQWTGETLDQNLYPDEPRISMGGEGKTWVRYLEGNPYLFYAGSATGSPGEFIAVYRLDAGGHTWIPSYVFDYGSIQKDAMPAALNTEACGNDTGIYTQLEEWVTKKINGQTVDIKNNNLQSINGVPNPSFVCFRWVWKASSTYQNGGSVMLPPGDTTDMTTSISVASNSALSVLQSSHGLDFNVDDNGNIWILDLMNAQYYMIEVPRTAGTDTLGNLKYPNSWDQAQAFLLPPTMFYHSANYFEPRRFVYDSNKDVLYIGGYSSAIDTLFNSYGVGTLQYANLTEVNDKRNLGDSLLRINNFLQSQTSQNGSESAPSWIDQIPYADLSLGIAYPTTPTTNYPVSEAPKSLDVAGNYVFVAYGYSNAIGVYCSSSGSQVGYIWRGSNYNKNTTTAEFSIMGTAWLDEYDAIRVNYEPNNNYRIYTEQTTSASNLVYNWTPTQAQDNSCGTYTIIASSGNGGTISPSGKILVNSNTSQAYTITPNSGYQIASVTVDGVQLTNTLTSYTFSDVTSNHTISATFTPITTSTYAITASSSDGGTISPSGTISINSNDSQVYTITPGLGYQTASVAINGINLRNYSTSYTFSHVTANQTISVTFVPFTYAISATPEGGGTISPNRITKVNYGRSQRYIITPSIGYQTTGVIVNGARLKNYSTSYTFSNVTADQSIIATFAPISYIISATPNGDGTISPNRKTNVDYGRSQVYTMTPSAGYKIASVIVDGAGLTNTPTNYTFSHVTENGHSIVVTFAPITYSLTISATNGTVTQSVNGSASSSPYNTRTVVRLTANPARGYRFSSWSGGAVRSSTSNPTTVGMNANERVTANFVRQQSDL